MSILAPILAPASARLSPALATPDVLSQLQQIATTLPPVPWAGFECRLADKAMQVDLQQGFELAKGDATQLRNYLAAWRSSAGQALPSAWERIDDFCQQWMTPTSTLHSISAIGFEFDITEAFAIGTPNQMQAPSLFLSFDQHDIPSATAWAATQDALRCLLDKPLSTAARHNLKQCFDLCPPEANISFIGIMLSRSLNAVRVNVKRLPQEQMHTYLQGVGWPGAFAEVETLLSELFEFVDRVTLCLDVGTSVYPTLGLECFLDEQPAQEPRWPLLLAYLVDRGLCTPHKRDGLLAWPGCITPLNSAAPWPATLLVNALCYAPDQFDQFNCWLNHIKLAYYPARPLEAKAYLGFRQQLYQAQAVTPAPQDSFVAAVSHRADDHNGLYQRVDEQAIVAAMAKAGAFLLSAQSQQGWWRDFQLPAGASDEWVTAYVGTALAAWARPDGQQAAARAWALLQNRRTVADGWGYNRLTPTDSDSTAWALQLAQVVGCYQTGRAQNAANFLESHLQSDGSVTTYADEGPIRGYYEAQAKSVPFVGWRNAHACVTAAVAQVPGMSAQTLVYLRNQQDPNGYWSGYWWCDAAYTTALAVEALAKTGRCADRQQVEQAVQWTIKRIGPNGACADVHGGESAFATAWSIRILAQAAALDSSRASMLLAVNWLLHQQRPNGAWQPSAWMRVPPPDTINPEAYPAGTLVICDRKAIFTTATVLAALQVAQTCLPRIRV